MFLNDKLDIKAWNDDPGRVLFEAAVGEKPLSPTPTLNTSRLSLSMIDFLISLSEMKAIL